MKRLWDDVIYLLAMGTLALGIIYFTLERLPK